MKHRSYREIDIMFKRKIPARKSADPWKLADDKVQADWTLIKSPALHMFRFKRVIIDEYTVRPSCVVR